MPSDLKPVSEEVLMNPDPRPPAKEAVLKKQHH